MRYAIIGMGFIYPRHLRAIHETDGKVVATCDVDRRRCSMFTDWREMLEKEESIEAVVICAPNYLHLEMAREALTMGKLVLCEKPLTIFSDLSGLEGVNTVMQLRHSPLIHALKKSGIQPSEVQLKVVVYRDDTYWQGWKGNEELSGGILYNLGIHYLDLLIHLLGDDYEVLFSEVTHTRADALVKFGNTKCEILIEIRSDRNGQERIIRLDGNTIPLSNKDNLSYENLHIEVYKAFLRGQGLGLKEAKKSLWFVRRLLQ